LNISGHEQVHPDDWESHWRKLSNITQFNPADEYRYGLVVLALNLPAAGQNSRILDAGCGTGSLIAHMRTAYPKADIAGIDFSTVAISFARRTNPDIQFTVFDLLAKDATPPPGYGHWATHCVCSEVVEHLDEPVEFLQSLKRWLAPGATLIVTVPAGPMAEYHRYVGHRQHFTAETITDVLTRSRFSIVRVNRAGFPFFNLYRFLTILAGKRLLQDIETEGGAARQSLSVRILFKILRPLFRLNAIDSALGWQIVAIAKNEA
jgi:SAM-dependent methyltransferase